MKQITKEDKKKKIVASIVTGIIFTAGMYVGYKIAGDKEFVKGCEYTNKQIQELLVAGKINAFTMEDGRHFHVFLKEVMVP